MKKLIISLILTGIVVSCDFLFESWEGFWFQNNTSNQIVVFAEGKHPNDSLYFSVSSKELNVIPSGICGMIYSDTWEKEVGKLDSVYLYILNYDLLFPDGNWHFIEDTKELNQEVFIARLSYKFLDLYDCHTHYCGTVVFPPPLDSDVPVIWYNGYSAEDFAVKEK